MTPDLLQVTTMHDLTSVLCFLVVSGFAIGLLVLGNRR